MAKNNSYKKFMVNFAKKGDQNIRLMSPYINSKAHIKVKCLKCGYEYGTTPRSLLLGYGCPKCAGWI